MTAAQNEAGKAGTRHGVLLLAAAVMPAMAIVSLVPVLPLLLQEFAHVPGSEILVPVALTLPALCVALFSPVAGWLADRIGRKRLLIGALIIYGLLGLLPIILVDLGAIIASRVGLGLAEAVIMTVATTLLGDYFDGDRRERWIALQIGVVSISAILLIAAGGALGQLGSRGPFLLYLLALPVAAACAFVLFEPERRHRSVAADGPRALPIARLASIIAITFVAGLLFYTLLVNLGPVLALAGVTAPAMIGIIGAAANSGIAAGSGLFRVIGDRRRASVLGVGFGLASLGYLGTSLAEAPLAMGSCIVLACIGAGLLLPTLLAWMLDCLPAELRGRGTGVWTGTFFLAQFVSPLLLTALTRLSGDLAEAIGLIGFAALVAACGSFAASLARRPRTNVQQQPR